MTNENRLATTHVIPYRPEIDGLRGLAVTLVVLVHAFPGYMKNGFIGVDIFFVISGFLITGILLTQLQGGSFSLRDFYIRRANRIFPALILVLTACIGFGWLSLYASEFKLLGRSVAGGAGFVANINAYLEGGYWDIAAKLKPLLHLWSLGVEEQFYLIWPALLFAAWTRHFNLAIVIIVLITTSLAWNLWSIGIDQPAAFYLPFSRLWELLAGAALAYFGGSPPAGIAETLVPSRILSNVCAFLGFALIIAGLADHFPSQEFPGKYAILPVLGTVLIIAAGPRAWLNSMFLSHRWVVYVGLISFPLYMWHWPLLTFARILENGALSTIFLGGALLLTVALSVVTYHFVERPIRKNPWRRGAVAVALGTLLAGCGAAGYSIYLHDGLEARYAAPNVTKAVMVFPRVTSEKKVVLLGDSEAGVFAQGLTPIYQNLVTFATSAWPYLVGVRYRPGLVLGPGQIGTVAMTEQAMAAIVSDPFVDVVIIAHMYVVYLDQDQIRSYPAVPGETGAMSYEAGLRRTVKLLTKAGKKVVYLKSIPFRADVASILACSSSTLPIPRKQPHDCLRSRADIQNSRAAYEQVLIRALDRITDVWVFDPLPYLCDQSTCYVERDGVLLYQDAAHLNVAGAQLVGAKLAKYVETIRNNASIHPNPSAPTNSSLH